MQLIRLSQDFTTDLIDGREAFPGPALRDSVLMLGSFDGMHLGHRALCERMNALKAARRYGCSCLFTFRDHPRGVLDAEHPRMLSSWREKMALLRDLDLDAVVAADFSPAMAGMSHVDFIRRFLIGFLDMRHLVGGHDIHLGAGRGGNAESLKALSTELGFGFDLVPARTLDDGRIISSSAIRRALVAGDLDTASAMLGRNYTLWGEVGYGDGRGASLGYPTANIEPLDSDKLLPGPGVYAVRVHLPADTVAPDTPGIIDRYRGALPEIDGSGELLGTLETGRVVMGGVMNYGTAPTLHAGGLPNPRLEVHILDFSGYIRERSLKLEWVRKLRDEMTFASLEALQAQLKRDEAETRALFF